MKDHETKNIQIGAVLGSLAINFCLIGGLTGVKGIIIPLAVAQPINYQSAEPVKTRIQPIDGQPEQKSKVGGVGNSKWSKIFGGGLRISGRSGRKPTKPWRGTQ